MAKPKGSKNPPSGDKTPDGSIIQITNPFTPVSLEDQLKKLKLDGESKIKASNEAQKEVSRGMLSSEEQENEQDTQMQLAHSLLSPGTIQIISLRFRRLERFLTYAPTCVMAQQRPRRNLQPFCGRSRKTTLPSRQ